MFTCQAQRLLGSAPPGVTWGQVTKPLPGYGHTKCRRIPGQLRPHTDLGTK